MSALLTNAMEKGRADKKSRGASSLRGKVPDQQRAPLGCKPVLKRPERATWLPQRCLLRVDYGLGAALGAETQQRGNRAAALVALTVKWGDADYDKNRRRNGWVRGW